MLSEAKHLCFLLKRQYIQILRYAQNDNFKSMYSSMRRAKKTSPKLENTSIINDAMMQSEFYKIARHEVFHSLLSILPLFKTAFICRLTCEIAFLS